MPCTRVTNWRSSAVWASIVPFAFTMPRIPYQASRDWRSAGVRKWVGDMALSAHERIDSPMSTVLPVGDSGLSRSATRCPGCPQPLRPGAPLRRLHPAPKVPLGGSVARRASRSAVGGHRDLWWHGLALSCDWRLKGQRGDRALLPMFWVARAPTGCGLSPAVAHSAWIVGRRNQVAVERCTASRYDPRMAPQRTPTDITDAPHCAPDDAPHGATQTLPSDAARPATGASVPESTSAPASPPSPTTKWARVHFFDQANPLLGNPPRISRTSPSSLAAVWTTKPR